MYITNQKRVCEFDNVHRRLSPFPLILDLRAVTRIADVKGDVFSTFVWLLEF